MLSRDFCKMPTAYAKIKYVRTPHLTISHTVHPSWNRYAVIYCIRKKYCSPSNAVLVLTTNSFQILPLPLSFLFSLPCLAFASPLPCLPFALPCSFLPSLMKSIHLYFEENIYWRKKKPPPYEVLIWNLLKLCWYGGKQGTRITVFSYFTCYLNDEANSHILLVSAGSTNTGLSCVNSKFTQKGFVPSDFRH